MLELISETNYRETMENIVEPKLASIREELSLPLEDGGALHAWETLLGSFWMGNGSDPCVRRACG